MNIISNDCTAGFIYKEINQEYKNPFIWTSIDLDNFIKLIENYDTLNFENISIRLEKNTSKISVQNELCPVITIDGIVDVHCFHYFQKEGKKAETNTKERYIYDQDIVKYAKKVYLSRLERMTEEPVFIWSNFEGFQWYKSSDINKLKNVKTKYKILVYTPKNIQFSYNYIPTIYKQYHETLVEKNAINISKLFKRTLVYTCCDEKYSHFIPLFCAALLWSNKNIDIEIGVSNKNLSNDEEKALNYLREQYPNSKILIKYNFFTVNSEKDKFHTALFNGHEMMVNSVRFVSEPTIKNEYTYITDIDIISFDKNFATEHIIRCLNENMMYDNIIRPNAPLHLSGLHFVVTNEYYPLNFNNIKFDKLDEQLLKDITSNKTELNKNLTRRPVHGIHMSLNREDPSGKTSLGWGAVPYKNQWYNFVNSEIYNNIKFSFNELITSLLQKLENFYSNDNK